MTAPKRPREALDHHVYRCRSILQMEAVECGAAALGMVLGYFGRDVTLPELRDRVGVSRNGSRADLILAAAHGYGLAAKGVAVNADQLRAMPGPVVAFWANHHFVVVEGAVGGSWQLNDPAMGRRTVTDADFRAGFSDIALTFEVTDAFVVARRGVGAYRRWLSARLRGSGTAIAFVLVAGLLSVVPTLAFAFLAGAFVTRILAARDGTGLWALVLMMVAFALAATMLAVLRSRVLFRLRTAVVIRLGSDYVWRLLRLPARFFTERSPGQLTAKMRLTNEVADLLSSQVASTVIAIINAVVFGAVLFWLEPLLAAVLLLVALVNIPVLRWSGRVRSARAARLRALQTESQGLGLYGLSTVDAIKMHATEDRFFARWWTAQTATVNSGQRFAVPDAMLAAARSTLTVLEAIVVLGLGTLLVLNGSLTVAALVTFSLLSRHFLGPIGDLSQVVGRLQTTRAAIDQLDDVLAAAVDPGAQIARSTSAGGPRDPRHATVEFVDVAFGYASSEPAVIEHLSFSVPVGGMVALVGDSGSGRSTVGRLAAGLEEPWGGQVLIGGVPIAAWVRRELAGTLGLVDQTIVLWAATVRENLRMWRDDVTDSDLTGAAVDACIHDDIVARRGGYSALVAANGANFSGGQAQRLQLARALARNPRILVLDDATSDLDADTEQAVMSALRARGVTCLVIAHRLSAVRNCDEVLVFQRGQVVQRGAPAQLEAEAGPYRALMVSA